MPGNFDDPLKLTDGRVEWPQGGLNGLNANEVPAWVEAWVVQGGGEVGGQFMIGPSQSSHHSPFWSGWTAPYDKWIANEPGWVTGKGDYQNGKAALGIALLATYDTVNHTHRYEWWSQVVTLQA
jgi:hypothetical protein